MADNVMGFIKDALEKSAADLSSSWFSDAKIYAEKILKCPPVCASITMPYQQLSADGNSVTTQTITIPFYMSNDFSIGGLTNEWTDLVNMDMVNTLSKFLNTAGSFTGSPQVSMQSEAMSLKTWKGSSFQGFSVECLFVSTRRSIVPPEIISALCTAALPTKLKGDNTAGNGIESLKTTVTGGVSWLGNQASNLIPAWKDQITKGTNTFNNLLEDVGMVAPLHYGLNITTDENNQQKPVGPIPGTTLTLQVGDWFRAPELIVASISNISFSKEVIAPPSFQGSTKSTDLYHPTADGSVSGYPLWGKCSVSLIPCSMMTKEKFESYFLKKADNSIIGKGGILNSAIGQGIISKGVDKVKNTFKLP